MKVIVSVLCLISSLSLYAQEDGRTVTMPFRVAKQIQSELISKDSCIDMINIMVEERVLLESNIHYKTMLIDTLTNQGIGLRNQFENERNMKLTYKGVAEDCKLEYDALKAKSDGYRKFTKVVAFIGTAVVTALTVVILIVK